MILRRYLKIISILAHTLEYVVRENVRGRHRVEVIKNSSEVRSRGHWLLSIERTRGMQRGLRLLTVLWTPGTEPYALSH